MVDYVEVETVRFRYQADEITRRRPTYTEWRLYVNGEMKISHRCGFRFKNINQFLAYAIDKYQIKEPIIRSKPHTVNLGFRCQKM